MLQRKKPERLFELMEEVAQAYNANIPQVALNCYGWKLIFWKILQPERDKICLPRVRCRIELDQFEIPKTFRHQQTIITLPILIHNGIEKSQNL
jgi:hypothetical protein